MPLPSPDTDTGHRPAPSPPLTGLASGSRSLFLWGGSGHQRVLPASRYMSTRTWPLERPRCSEKSNLKKPQPRYGVGLWSTHGSGRQGSESAIQQPKRSTVVRSPGQAHSQSCRGQRPARRTGVRLIQATSGQFQPQGVHRLTVCFGPFNVSVPQFPLL